MCNSLQVMPLCFSGLPGEPSLLSCFPKDAGYSLACGQSGHLVWFLCCSSFPLMIYNAALQLLFSGNNSTKHSLVVTYLWSFATHVSKCWLMYQLIIK